jgi:hypothetical protein
MSIENKSTKNRAFVRKIAGAGALALAIGAIAGCSSTPVPTDEVALSKSAVQTAIAAGGSEFAAVELKTAQDKVEAAEKAIDDDDNLKAKHLAEAATVDAKLAENKALAAKAEKSLSESRDGQRVLLEEVQRQQTP